MSDRRIDRTEGPRDDGVYASRIERDKKEQEKFRRLPAGDKKILIATFFSYLKKMFESFSPSKDLAGKVVDQQTMIEHLLALRRLLERLGNENLSNSSDFASALSETWTKLIDDFDNIEIMERKNLQEIATFREMMDTIKNYPLDTEHRFGYYLLQQAGKDWLPFPFIEILEKLHLDHQKDPKQSTLAKWFKLIDNAIANLKKNLPFKL